MGREVKRRTVEEGEKERKGWRELSEKIGAGDEETR